MNGRSLAPPEQPMFPMGTTAAVTVRKKDQTEAKLNITIPNPRTRRQPYAEPRAFRFESWMAILAISKPQSFPDSWALMWLENSTPLSPA
jgi:hypothetical protein